MFLTCELVNAANFVTYLEEKGNATQRFSSASSLEFPNPGMNLWLVTPGYQARILAARAGWAPHRAQLPCRRLALLAMPAHSAFSCSFCSTALLLARSSDSHLCGSEDVATCRKLTVCVTSGSGAL